MRLRLALCAISRNKAPTIAGQRRGVARSKRDRPANFILSKYTNSSDLRVIVVNDSEKYTGAVSQGVVHYRRAIRAELELKTQ